MFRATVFVYLALGSLSCLSQDRSVDPVQHGAPRRGTETTRKLSGLPQQNGFITIDAPGAGTGPMEGTAAVNINSNGDVTGLYLDNNNAAHGFVRLASNGVVTPFDAPNAGNLNAQGTFPITISSVGTVVGFYVDSNSVDHAFIRLSNGAVTEFDGPNADQFGGLGTVATAINASGVIAGSFQHSAVHGFIRATNGAITTIDVANSDGTFCIAINASGTVAGTYSDLNTDAYHGFIFANGTFTLFDAPGAGTNSGQGTMPVSIDTAGDVAGTYVDSNMIAHAFVRTANGTITTFDSPNAGIYGWQKLFGLRQSTAPVQGSYGLFINDSGVTSGTSIDGNLVGHGFLRAANGSVGTYDAPGAGTAIMEGTVGVGINASGFVTGGFIDGNQVIHGFIANQPSVSNDLIVTTSGTGTGTVTSGDGFINCGTTCSHAYNAGATVTLTATPGSNSTFTSWTGCDTVQGNTCTVTVNNSRNVTATFASLDLLSVSLFGSGSGTVTSSDGKINCGGTCSAYYPDGTIVTLTATPNSTSAFSNWYGCDSVQGNVCTVTMHYGRYVYADFIASDVLSVSVVGNGTVTSSDGFIHCPSTCSHGYNPGTFVVLTATPGSNAVFTSWSGCDSVQGNICYVTVNSLRNVTATFTATYVLSVSVVGNGTATSSDGFINCGSVCSHSYLAGTTVTLTATPGSNSAFSSWNGCDSVQGNVCTVTMNSVRNVTATFVATYVLSVSKVGNGTVISSDGFINCGTACSHTYVTGTYVRLTASPAQGWAFVNWTGCDQMNGPLCTLQINSPRNVVATFVPTYLLSVSTTGTGSVISGDGHINCGTACSFLYPQGTHIGLTAVPGTGYTFSGWTGCTTVQGNSCSVVMSAAENVIATFSTTPITVVSLTLRPSTVMGGRIAVATVTLSQPAPTGGVGVNITSSNPRVAHPPAQIVVSGGRTSISFAVRTSQVTADTVVTVTASINGTQATGTLTITAP